MKFGKMITKICIECGEEKSISDFSPDKRREHGVISVCRPCMRKRGKLRRPNRTEEQRTKRREAKRRYDRANKDKKSKWDKAYREAHKDKIYQNKHNYYLKNKARLSQYKKDYYGKNRDRIRAYKHQYYLSHMESEKNRARQYCEDNRELVNRRIVEYKNNNKWARLAHNMRSRIGNIIKGRSSGGRLLELVGCDKDSFIAHIEALWDDKMNWGNYGRGRGKWSLDHIVPIEWFDLNDAHELKKAFHYLNVQPMWYSENSSKSNRYCGKHKGQNTV